MGGTKQLWIEQHERGYRDTGKVICGDCVENPDFREKISLDGNKDTCSYCNIHKWCLSLDVILQTFKESIQQYYMNYDSIGVPWPSDEDGYASSVLDTDEVLFELEYPESNEDLRNDICYAFEEVQWTRVSDYYPEDSRVLQYSWDSFSRLTKHFRRYTFAQMETDEHSELSPADLLQRIQGLVLHLKLVSQVTLIDIFRARNVKKKVSKAADLGAPPLASATQPNRMSPSGVSMFYGSSEVETAIAEVLQPRGKFKFYSVGRFTPSRSVNLLNLTRLPSVPGIFSNDSGYRESVIFIRKFSEEISKPIANGSSEHIEYVPSQIFTEYIRSFLKTQDGQSIDGIIYRSAKTDGICYAVFVDNPHCVESIDRESPDLYMVLDGVENHKKGGKLIKRLKKRLKQG